MTAFLIRACVCGVTVVFDGEKKVEWFTGAVHDCRRNSAGTVEALASDALNGDADAARLLPEAVEEWLAW